ncbi:hypothetical protein AB4Z46_31490 [Variovorax sp. M-6]|uniref:hypothetical protein n=1 Tax=Variovorax sp. M-6 TaxID=3233041 RepID=UPI003F982DD1
MTLICAYDVQNFPVVFGDLLVSGASGPSDQQVGVPALGDVTDFFEGSGWSILGLRQKVSLISDHCAVAWAGSWLGARVAIARLREMAQEAPLTADSIRAYLRSEVELNEHPASFVGWIFEETEEGRGLRQFGFGDGTLVDGGVLGCIRATGSGAPAVLEFAQIANATKWKASEEAGPAIFGFASALVLAGILLREEREGGLAAKTLRSLFGGGYEVAGFVNGKFTKLSDFTIILWDASVDDDGLVRIEWPRLILKQTYKKDVLLLKSAIVGTGEDGKPKLFAEEGHAVMPMFESTERIVAEDILGISFESRLLAHIFMGRTSCGVGAYARVQQTSPETMPAKTFRDLQGYLSMAPTASFLQEVVESLRSMAPQREVAKRS